MRDFLPSTKRAEEVARDSKVLCVWFVEDPPSTHFEICQFGLNAPHTTMGKMSAPVATV